MAARPASEEAAAGRRLVRQLVFQHPLPHPVTQYFPPVVTGDVDEVALALPLRPPSSSSALSLKPSLLSSFLCSVHPILRLEHKPVQKEASRQVYELEQLHKSDWWWIFLHE